MYKGEIKSFLPIEPVDFDFGGRLTVPSRNGGEATMTRMGEFEAHEHPEGGAMMVFPERGIVAYYHEDQRLGLVNVSLSDYFAGMMNEQLGNFPNNGREIRRFVEKIGDAPIDLNVAVVLDTGEVKLFEVDKTTGNSVEVLDLGSLSDTDVLSGAFMFNDESKISYLVNLMDQDVIKIGFGEYVGVPSRVIQFGVGTLVDYEWYMFKSRDPRRLQDLANAVLKVEGSVFG